MFTWAHWPVAGWQPGDSVSSPRKQYWTMIHARIEEQLLRHKVYTYTEKYLKESTCTVYGSYEI